MARPLSPRNQERSRHVRRGRAFHARNRAPLAGSKYVYCIIRCSQPLRFGPIGIGAVPAEVYTVHYRKLAAVVSEAPQGAPEPSRENFLAHERVNAAVMRAHTLIPMSFGTVFKTHEDVVQLLRSTAKAFGEVLNKLHNKVEFGLQVLWDRGKAVQDAEREVEDISRLKEEIAGQDGATYFARMEYGRLVESALRSRADRHVLDILKQLGNASVAWRVNKPVGEGMIMNAAFLVARDGQSAFEARVKAIASRFEKLTFRYTGPWPAYNFVNIRLKLQRAQA